MRGSLPGQHATDEIAGGDEARPEVLQQRDEPLHPRQRPHEVVIVTEAGGELGPPHARLRRIELPRVQVHDVVAVAHEGPRDQAPEQRGREHAEVPAAGDRERRRPEALDGKRELDQAVVGPIDTGPQATPSRTSSGSRSAAQPRTKKVARTPCDSRRSSTTRVPSAARRGRSSHPARGNTARRFSTWNHSSMSNVRTPWRTHRSVTIDGDGCLAIVSSISSP